MERQVLRSPYYKDIPKAFKQNNFQGQEQLLGAYGRLIQLFAVYMNYSLELVEEDNLRMTDVQADIENNIYNISMPSCSLANRFADVDFTYPLESTFTCVMVPAEDELPRYWYVVWPFGRYIWLFLGISVLYVACVMTYLKHPKRSFRFNLLHSLAFVISSPNATIRLVNISLRLQLFYSLLLIMGFIMSSYYGSFLTVYNMKPLFQPYINSIDDALEANIKILVSSNTLEELQNNNYVDLSGIEQLLVEIDSVNIMDSINHLNCSHGYIVSQTHWDFMAKLQKNLIQPIYQLSDICFGQTYNAYPMKMNAQFAQKLQIFILLCKQSGLWEYWQDEAFIMILNRDMIKVLLDEYPVDPLALSYYYIAWIVFIGGMIISCIAFVCELFCFNYKFRCCCTRNITVNI